jgi:hypothetical protein
MPVERLRRQFGRQVRRVRVCRRIVALSKVHLFRSPLSRLPRRRPAAVDDDYTWLCCPRPGLDCHVLTQNSTAPR